MSTQLFTWGFSTFQVFRLRTWFYAAPTFMLFLMTPSRKHHGGNLAIHLIRLKKVPFCVFDISSWLVKSIYCNPLSWTTQRFSQAFTSNKHVKHHELISYPVHSKLMVRFWQPQPFDQPYQTWASSYARGVCTLQLMFSSGRGTFDDTSLHAAGTSYMQWREYTHTNEVWHPWCKAALHSSFHVSSASASVSLLRNITLHKFISWIDIWHCPLISNAILIISMFPWLQCADAVLDLDPEASSQSECTFGQVMERRVQ